MTFTPAHAYFSFPNHCSSPLHGAHNLGGADANPILERRRSNHGPDIPPAAFGP